MKKQMWRPVSVWLCLVMLLLVLVMARESEAPGVQARARATAFETTPDAAVQALKAMEPTSIALTAERTTIGKKETLQLVLVLYPEGAASAISFKSSRSLNVSVNRDGVVTGKRIGSATITATTANGLKASLEITVKKAPTGVSVIADRTTLGVGESLQLGYALSSGSAGAVSFSAPENNGVLTVSPDGLITAVAPGKATVTATTFNGRKKSMVITVIPGPQKIHLSTANISIGVGDEYLFKAEMNAGAPGTFRFSSQDPEIAVIDPITGRLIAVNEGQTTITATAYNGVSDSATVNILPPPAQIVLNGMEVAEDGQYRLKLRKSERWPVMLVPSEYSDIGLSFSSTQPAVADVDETGSILAQRSGSTQIAVRTYNGLTMSIQVTVEKWTDESQRLIISHAMGGIDGQTYTNSLEAFQENYAEGHRYFEVDFSYTSDGQLVLWHDWKKNRINSSVKRGYVPSKAEFSSMRIYDHYTPLTLEDLFKLMLQYPDIWIVSDTKETRAAVVRRQFAQIVSTADQMGARNTLKRWIVYLYSKEMYDVVESVYSFGRYAFALYKTYYHAPSKGQMKDIAAFCEQRGIEWIIMSQKWWKKDYAPILAQYDVDVGLYTVNSASEAQKYLDEGARVIITDVLSSGGT